MTTWTPADIMAASRMQVYERHPYLSHALFALRPCPAPGLGTLAVDEGWRLYYDPETVVQWHDEMVEGRANRIGGVQGGHHGVAAVVFHELGHVLRQHHARRGDRDPTCANAAMDREINDDALVSGWRLPGEPLMPSDIGKENGLTFEEYYQPYDTRLKPSQWEAFKSAPGCGGKCGGAAGNPTDWEKQHSGAETTTCGGGFAPGEGDRGQDTAPSPLPAHEQEVVLRQTALAVARHVKAHGRGTVPAGLVAWADAKLEPPKVDWRKRLAALTRGALAAVAGASDFTWRRTGRRALYSSGRAGWPLAPALHQPEIRACVVVDCSGSMLGDKLAEAISEVQGILRSTGSVEVLSMDAAVHDFGKAVKISDVTRRLKGCGGTSFVPAFEFLLKRKPRPDVVVVFTDGWGDAPESPPPFKTIWALVGDGATKPCKWGEEVRIGQD